jgi:peptide deformylase
MPLMKILHIPDPRLRVKTSVVTQIDDQLQTIIDDMFETMYDAPGVGLASTQVGLTMRLTVIDVSQEKNQPMVFINPEIVEAKDFDKVDEGCLSVPGHYDTVTRAKWVKVKALDRKGKEFTLETDGLLAQCLQHEIDHLNGKVYIDQLSRLKSHRIHEKVKKFVRDKKP